MSDGESLRNPVLRTIRNFPGIHLRGIVRQLSTSTALTRHHVQSLIQEGVVRAVHLGGFVRYFPAESFAELSTRDRRILNVLRQERPLEIALALLEFGAMQHRDLLEIVGGGKATLSYQLEKLVDAGVVTRVAKGPDRGYHLASPADVRRILARYDPLPEVLESVHDTWEDLFGGHRRKGTAPSDDDE